MNKQVGFLLIPQFSMLAFTAAIEPLRVANRFLATPFYQWRLLSEHGEPVESSNGITVIADRAIGGGQGLDQIMVCAGFDAELGASKSIMRWLNSLTRDAVEFGAISTGSFILARAGLLDGFRCTTHWENIAAFRERFPKLEVTDHLFEIDGNRLTCSGGTAALDMMLHLIEREHGRGLATTVSEQFIHDRLRAPGDSQRMAEQVMLLQQSPKLAAAIKLMRKHIEEPLPAGELARRIGLSLRQLERLFKRHQGQTPQRYYLALRLRHAQQLLRQTGGSIINVALATGFVSQSHFTKCYREYFGRTPQRERVTNSTD